MTIKHKLSPLPYARDALEPHISRETLDYHYGKHHATYVKKLNELIPGTKFENASLEDIVVRATDSIFNNGAQVWNHDFYWQCLSPSGGGSPRGDLAGEINSAFQSFAGFKKAFNEAAEGLFGTGWVWLVRSKDGKLSIFNGPDAGNPLREGKTPLLTCDVWEHAYYIDRRNSRPDYLKAFWSLVNWEFVAGRR